MIASPLQTVEPIIRPAATLLAGTGLRKRFGPTEALRGIDFSLGVRLQLLLVAAIRSDFR